MLYNSQIFRIVMPVFGYFLKTYCFNAYVLQIADTLRYTIMQMENSPVCFFKFL